MTGANFFRRRSTTINVTDDIRRLFYVIQEARTLPTLTAILSVDVKKAFDRLEWNYLWPVMETLGHGAKFINMVCVLYANPMAIVLTNGLHSELFSIEWFSQKGCLLSSTLFAISLEPLVQMIRQNCNI